MLLQQCRHQYRRYTKVNLYGFILEIENGIFNNPMVFQAPPMTHADFIATRETFIFCMAEYDTYGLTKKTAYFTARKAIFASLDILAAYVDSVAKGNASTIALSGFKSTIAVPQKNVSLEKIPFFTVKHTNVSGELLVEIPFIKNSGSVTYTCFCIESPEVPNVTLHNGQLRCNGSDLPFLMDMNKTRKKKFYGLNPRVLYHLYAFASNSVSVSPLSDVKSVWVY